MFRLLYLIIRKISSILFNAYCYCVTYVRFKGSGVKFSSFKTKGSPYVVVARGGGKMKIGRNFAMNNGIKGNPIGCYEKCTFFVDRDCELIIGDNVGISQSALISHCSIKIGNNVKIGGGTCIYTSDFHSLNPIVRSSSEDLKKRKCAPVEIDDNAFVGAKCIILKGVKVGENSIIGAGSVVTTSIPANEIWAGNPARLIRKI